MTDARAANPWLPRRARREGALALYAFPYAGGGSAAFHALARDLPDWIDLIPVHLPGRERRIREPAHRRVDALSAALERALGQELAPPFAFLGHSYGALVAFELACALRAAGRPGPVHLAVSAARAPRCIAAGALHALPDDAFLSSVAALGGMPAAVLRDAEILQLLLPTLRADFEAYETYRAPAAPPLECPVTAVGGRADASVAPEELERWRETTRGAFELRWIDGDHFFLQSSPLALAEILASALASHAPTPL